MTRDRTAFDRTGIGPACLRAAVVGVLVLAAAGCEVFTDPEPPEPSFDGQDVFRHATFGNEVYWTDTLQLHRVIESSVDPKTALSVGLKVDAAALPEGLLSSADLDDPATTVELIRRDAVVGIQGSVDSAGPLSAAEGIAPELGPGPVRRLLEPGRNQRSRRDPPGLRSPGRGAGDLHR